MGAREQYRPIRTPPPPATDVARGLSVFILLASSIADSDAIAGSKERCRSQQGKFPHSTFWVDNGIADRASAERLDADLGHLVLGSDAKDKAVLRRLCKDDRIVLSLDYRGDDFITGSIAEQCRRGRRSR
jgi:phosphoribosylformimino-5-aminoimidazole carboxamide ribotide isomerase